MFLIFVFHFPPGPPSAGPLPSAGPPKISRCFSLSRLHFRSFSLSGVFSLNFGGVFEGRDPQMCTFGVLGLSCETPAAPTAAGVSNEKTSRERERERKKKRAKMGAGDGKKREILGSPLSGPHLSSPHTAGPHTSGPHSSSPNPWVPNFFSGPHPSGSTLLWAPPFGPPAFGRRLSGPPLFLGLGHYVPHFYHVAHLFLFCDFLIVSISCHFWEKFSLFLFLLLFFFFENFLNNFKTFFIFQVGVEGEGRGANKNPKLVSSVGRKGVTTPQTSPQTSVGFGREGGGLLPPKPKLSL